MSIRAAVLAAVLLLGPAAAATSADAGCLASTMWGEARGDGEIAMLAVADVILNRVERSGRSICAEVRAPGQFDGYGRRAPAWVEDVARRAMAGDGRGITSGAMYFTAHWDRPRWTRRLRVTARVGGNVFYAGREL